MRPNRAHFLAPLALALTACTYAPLAPVPEPLPEALPWSTPEAVPQSAFLGLEVRENDSGSLDQLFFEPGLRVTRVERNSPAERAGFAIGDVLLAFDGHAVDEAESLDALLRRAEPGARVALEARREDTAFEVELELAAAGGSSPSEVRPLYRLDPARTRAGWATGERGVVLVSSAPGGPMERAGIPLGSVVVAIDGAEVLSDRELVRELAARAPGAEVTLDVLDEHGAAQPRELVLQDQPRRLTGVGFPILFHYDADPAGASTTFVLIDLWIISLYAYEREGNEKEWRVLRFIRWSSGVGELAE